MFFDDPVYKLNKGDMFKLLFLFFLSNLEIFNLQIHQTKKQQITEKRESLLFFPCQIICVVETNELEM